MYKRLTRAAIFILLYASLPLGVLTRTPYRKAEPADIEARRILWARPNKLVPTYKELDTANWKHPVVILREPSNLKTEMVPVAFLTHSPLRFLPTEPTSEYSIPEILTERSQTIKQKKQNQVILVQQKINYEDLIVMLDSNGQMFENHAPPDGLEKLLKDIDNAAKARIQAGSCVLLWVEDDSWFHGLTPTEVHQKGSTSAIILSELDPKAKDDGVWVAEIKYTNTVKFATNPGIKYGLPPPKSDERSQQLVQEYKLNLNVRMAKEKISYRRIFPLYESSGSPWQLAGHKLSTDKLMMLNKDIDGTPDKTQPPDSEKATNYRDRDRKVSLIRSKPSWRRPPPEEQPRWHSRDSWRKPT